jgi:hypothetical protein
MKTISSRANPQPIHILFFAIFAVLLGLLLSALTAPTDFLETLVREGGLVETLSAAGYLVVIASLVRESDAKFLRQHWYFVVIPMAMCLRELDFHNLWTTMSITRLDFYLSSTVPAHERLAAIMVIAIIVCSGYVMLARHWKSFWNSLVVGNPVAIAIGLSGLAVVASKTLDGLPRKLAEIGIGSNVDFAITANAVEEILELGIPLFLMAAVFAYYPTRRVRMQHREVG